jgi:hypothetical protein
MGDDDYVAACCMNGRDGVGVGYGHALVPRQEGAPRTIVDREDYGTPSDEKEEETNDETDVNE